MFESSFWSPHVTKKNNVGVRFEPITCYSVHCSSISFLQKVYFSSRRYEMRKFEAKNALILLPFLHFFYAPHVQIKGQQSRKKICTCNKNAYNLFSYVNGCKQMTPLQIKHPINSSYKGPFFSFLFIFKGRAYISLRYPRH